MLETFNMNSLGRREEEKQPNPPRVVSSCLDQLVCSLNEHVYKLEVMSLYACVYVSV